jgi:uncharacterized protein (DUF1015 family)
VASDAYDVMSREEARLIAGANPLSFLKIERSEINLPDAIDPPDPRVYQSACDALQAMVREGVMIQDETPCFYLYRQQADSHVQTGIVACFESEDYRSGRIKRHELTRSDKETDRTRHIDRLNAQTGPVFLAYRDNGSVDSIIDGITSRQQPEYAFRADDRTFHSAWIVRDARTMDRIADAFEKIDSLYIADGHHRAAAANRVAEIRRQANPAHTGAEEYNRIMAVLFSHRQLRILPYNRVVRDLAGMGKEAFLDRLSDRFLLEPLERNAPAPERGVFGMYLGGQWFRLSPTGEGCGNNDIVSSLDVSVLQDRLIAPILGVTDMRGDERIDFVGGIRGTGELERLVDADLYAVAFSLYPTDMDSLMAVSDKGQIMPPKSTWFEPKLKSGLFVHLLD